MIDLVSLFILSEILLRLGVKVGMDALSKFSSLLFLLIYRVDILSSILFMSLASYLDFGLI